MPYKSSRTRDRMTETTRAAHPYGSRREERFPVGSAAADDIDPRDGVIQDQTDQSLIGFGTISTMTT